MGTGVLLFVGVLCGCDSREQGQDDVTSESPSTEKTMKLTSSSFADGSTIDAQYTVEGEDISPPLSWSEAPSGTASFALICDDPDAPSPRRPAANPWVHWVIFNIPAELSELPPCISRRLGPGEVTGARQGKNSF